MARRASDDDERSRGDENVQRSAWSRRQTWLARLAKLARKRRGGGKNDARLMLTTTCFEKNRTRARVAAFGRAKARDIPPCLKESKSFRICMRINMPRKRAQRKYYNLEAS